MINRRKKSATGSVRSKKQVIDGIEFASSLEAYTYRKLKESGLEFGYETRTFELLPSFRFPHTYYASTPKKKELVNKTDKVVRSITYTPDFVGDKWVIETKGFVPSNHSFPLRWKLFLTESMKEGLSVFILSLIHI